MTPWFLVGTLLLLLWAGMLPAAAAAPPVLLDARDPSAGSDTWINRGSLGPFHRIGTPEIRTINGVRAVFLDGQKDAYRGPVSPAVLEGRSPRTIQVWVYKPVVRRAEETLVAWGKRGGPAGANMALNYGRSPAFGAATHWAEDMGWNGTPTPGQWHDLVYTYDGRTAKVYDNGVLKNALRVALDTAPGESINLGVQNGARGALQFLNEYNREPMTGPTALAEVRIETRALSAIEIKREFVAEARRFHAVSPAAPYDQLMAQGVQRLKAGPLTLTLARSTGEALSLVAASGFDFLPSDLLMTRSEDGAYQLGDIDFRTRLPGGDWQSYSTAKRTRAPARQVPGAMAAEDLSAVVGPGCPLAVERIWAKGAGGPVLRFVLRNRSGKPVELGAFGAAMVHNNVLTNRSLEEAHERCCFADPYIGGPAGYLQMTRLNGRGPVLLVLPEKGTSFEAYRPLHDDPTPRSVTFEGFYEWTVLSRAYAENEWKGAQEWNPPTSRVLRPGETVSYGFRFVLAPGVREIEPTLIAQGQPVAVGIPGTVIPTDEPGRLFLHAPTAVRRLRVEPAGALRIQRQGSRPGGWQAFLLTGVRPGRCRLTVQYAGSPTQFIHVFVTPAAADLVRRFGEFHAAHQWFTDPRDPFYRTDSFLPYNRRQERMITQYDPTWMVGLSDEMGAGPNLAMAVKNLNQPDPAQVKLLEQYVDHALWGHLQNPDYGIRASLFYYDPQALPNYPYTVRGGWDKERSETTWRSFNYPHQAAVYWSLYRLARDHPGLVTAHPWQWYLQQAYRTAMAMGTHAGPPPGGLQQFGQMVGDVYLETLRDLWREGWTADAGKLSAYERVRAEHFRSLKYPFGSEMPWDSTGQEEVYLLCRYFGFVDKADQTIAAVLGYDPTVPNWGYNGAARRYFDEAVNGTAWPDIMRLLHHYGGGMNAVPLLAQYRSHPDDLYLLRVGYGGTMGALTDLRPDGAASQCFDPDPAIMRFDPYVGDYGIEFYGFSVNSGSYVARDPRFGWIGFGCNVTQTGGAVRIAPRDAFRNRLYIAPAGVYLTLAAGTIESAAFDPSRGIVRLTLAPRTPFTTNALLRVTTPGRADLRYQPSTQLAQTRGAYVVPLRREPVTVILTGKPNSLPSPGRGSRAVRRRRRA